MTDEHQQKIEKPKNINIITWPMNKDRNIWKLKKNIKKT